MNYKTEICGMRFFRGDDGSANFIKLAVAEIYIPELSANITDVMLTWSKSKGWVAQAPYSKRGAFPLIQWNYHGAFATDLAEKLRAMFLAMGGRNPEKPQRRFVPYSELAIDPDSETPLRDQAQAELERIHVETGEEVFTSILDLPEPEADDTEASEGLHRTLGLDPAVAEACDRAGL